MKHYGRNIWSWLRGFVWLWDEEKVGGWKPGWGPWKFRPWYAVNVGSHVLLTGGACQTWSRAFWEWRQSGSRAAKFADRVLQKILGDGHGENSGPALWVTTPCTPRVRLGVMVGWAWLALMLWLS